ncbi:MAG: CoA pyrophosphatase [Gammaproteobacteria bacterium]
MIQWPADIALDADSCCAFRSRAISRRSLRQSADGGELRAAAVAVTLVGDDHGRACFVITRRAANLRRHAGQWALPGGRIDLGETAEQAALRELAEEVGCRLEAGAVLGLLDDYATRSGYVITPVVIWGGAAPTLIANPHEVGAIYRVRLDDLLKPEVPRLHSIPESERPVISIPLWSALHTEVFAPTAAVLYQLREVALLGRATRVDGFEQPLFAWR